MPELGETADGLLCMAPQAVDWHAALRAVAVPLNRLVETELCPRTQTLVKINGACAEARRAPSRCKEPLRRARLEGSDSLGDSGGVMSVTAINHEPLPTPRGTGMYSRGRVPTLASSFH